MWQPKVKRGVGERVWIRGQGEIVHHRSWPGTVPYLPMTGKRSGPRLPRGEGQHVFICGGSGAGKTTSAQRLAVGRVRADKTALLAIDAKGDQKDEQVLRRIAAAGGVPFILIDPRAESTDRWQPLWGSVADVVARAVEPIKASEPYYYEMLRDHVGIVVEILRAAERWPVSFPLLADAVQPQRFGKLLTLAQAHNAGSPALIDRCQEQLEWVNSLEGRKALGGGARRLRGVMGQAWRAVLEPRITPNGEAVAVHLVRAIRQRAVVLWRTWADDMADEAKAITVLALADIYAAAGHANARWTLMLDEFGAVIQVAAELPRFLRTPPGRAGEPRLAGEVDGHDRAVAINRPDRRARQHALRPGKPPARARVPGRLGRIRDAPRRRSSDPHTTLGPEPARAQILRVALAENEPERIGTDQQHPCEARCHSEITLPRHVHSTTAGQGPLRNELGSLEEI